MPGVTNAQGSHMELANRSAGMKAPPHASQSCKAVASAIITQKAEIITQEGVRRCGRLLPGSPMAPMGGAAAYFIC
jgi:hypothetical protein